MSMSMRFALSLVALVAALVLVHPGGVAFAATEDVTVGSPEPARGKPDDWGSPQGRPDDFGNSAHSGPESEFGLQRGGERSLDSPRSLHSAGRPDDWGRQYTAQVVRRIVLHLIRF